jgi:hypothetical protein
VNVSPIKAIVHLPPLNPQTAGPANSIRSAWLTQRGINAQIEKPLFSNSPAPIKYHTCW